MNIGAASKATGLPPKTIRYYEDINLVVADRRTNKYRDYSEEHVHKLRFLYRARNLGFSIDKCRILLSLYEDKDRNSIEIKSIAKAHVQDIESKIFELQELRRTLVYLIKHCDGDIRPSFPAINDPSNIECTSPALYRKKH
jgi:MerR family transcriptional regulator, copper efflux regulator